MAIRTNGSIISHSLDNSSNMTEKLISRHGRHPRVFCIDYGEHQFLFDAICTNKPNTVRRMIKEGSDVNQLIGEGHHSPLLEALNNEAFHAARILIYHGASVLHEDTIIGLTPLHIICSISSNYVYRASEEERYEIYKLLLDKGAECDSRDIDGATQLHYALLKRSLRIITVLLDRGAHITALDKSNRTALHWAAHNRDVEVIEFVMNQGFDIK